MNRRPVVNATPAGFLNIGGFNLAIALLYIAAGGLGLQLAVPPGYATIIWPASGIAIAGLLLYGERLTPGIFLGSFILNCFVGGVFSAAEVDPKAIVVAAMIASGSTIQALLALFLVRRFFGIPVRMSGFPHIVLFVLVCGPLSCLLAPSIGVFALYAAGLVSYDLLAANWLTWWAGDMLGVLVFLPISLFNPWRTWSIEWSGRPVAGFTVVTLLCLIIPLATTFYAWKYTSAVTFQKNQAAFEAMMEDNQHNLIDRLDSYRQALDGGAGLFHASGHVTRNDWRTYVETLDITRKLPGINGIGFIEPVEKDMLDIYPHLIRADGVPNLVIHPKDAAFGNFIIKYIEPIGPNRAAVGLDIGFEQNRYEAAIHARDTGEPTITKRIFLVQDEEKTPGFLLLRPMYEVGHPVHSVEDRKKSFHGWIYAPFIASRFMDGLTASQGASLNITVYDGPAANPGQLIYSSKAPSSDTRRRGAFHVEKQISVMEQQWTVVWDSTRAFEAGTASSEPFLVLVGGLALTALFGALLLSYTKREESIRAMVELKTREIVAREHENRSVVDNAVVGIVVVDEQGGILTANKAVEAVFGYTTDELEHKPLSSILGSGYTVMENAPLDDFGRRSKEPELRRGPVKSFTRDRKELFLDVQLNSWMTESGEFRYTAIIRNVTDQQQAVMALEQTERRWNYALQGSDIGVFDIDLLSGGSVVSATWKTMLGFDADENIDAQKEWLARVHPEDMGAVMEADRACQAGEIPRSIAEYRIRRKDGSWIWMRSDAVVVERDEAGKATRLIGTQTDVTELRYAEAALRASEEQFRAAIEHAPIGMALITLDRNWIKVNQALCTLLGYTEDELLKLDREKLIHPDERDSDRELSAKLIAGEIPSYQIEKRYFHSDGHILWVQLSVSIAHDVDTDTDYFIAQMQDITDQKEIERLKSEFVATVSHELRTPLTSIRGSLGLVLGAMAKDIPENANRLLTIAHSNCERLVLLINDILDLEKISSGKMRFDAKKERIADIVEQALEATQGYANEHAVEQTLSGTIPDCYAEVDQTRLHQVLANLLSNAAKFSPKGATVTVSAQVVENRIRINVADKGPGISPEFRSRIFGRFSQADGSASRAKSGTGLGLHISRMIMEQMGGTIGFDSEFGEGATFWIELPLMTEGRSFSDGAAAYKLDSTLPSILHVEDDADFREVVAAFFRDKAQVMSAATINGARTWLDTVSFDLVIIDVGLYNGNGLELLEDTAAKGIPAIVLSAQEDLENDPRVKRFYSKSKVDEAHLVRSVMKILEKSRGSKTIELRKSA